MSFWESERYPGVEVPQKHMTLLLRVLDGRVPDDHENSPHVHSCAYHFRGRVLVVHFGVGDNWPYSAEILYPNAHYPDD